MARGGRGSVGLWSEGAAFKIRRSRRNDRKRQVKSVSQPLPADVLPDRELHAICQRCGKWFARTDGGLVSPESKSALLFRIGGGGSPYRFQCHRCSQIRGATEIGIWALFLGLVGAILILEKLGFIQ
jgi:hypothetical protein